MKKKLINLAKIIFFLSLGILFIWLFMHNLTQEEKKEIYSSFLQANYWWLVVSIFIGIFSHISRAVRWKILLEPMGFKPKTFNTFLAVMIGYFANLALPRLGEVSRCGVLARYERIPMQKSFGTVVTERIIDLISLASAFFLAIVFHLDRFNMFKQTGLYKSGIERYNGLENPGYLYWSVLFIIILLAYLSYRFRKVVAHTIVYQKIKELIKGFGEGLKSLTKIKKPFWFIFHSIVIWVFYLLMSWVVFFSLPETSNLGLDVGLLVLVFGSIGIIIVQGGIGIYPWIVAEVLLMFSIPQTKGYAMGWLLWIGQTVMIIALGIFSMAVLPFINRQSNELQQTEPIQNS